MTQASGSVSEWWMVGGRAVRLDDDVPEAMRSLNNTVRFVRDVDGTQYVLRRGRSGAAQVLGIVGEEEHAAIEAAVSSGIAPRLLSYNPDGTMLSARVAGAREWTDVDWRTPTALPRAARLLRRLLETPAPSPAATTSQRLERMAAEWRRGPGSDEIRQVLTSIPRVAAELDADRRYPRSLAHHDFWVNNILDDGADLWLIDYEFAGAGDGWYDIASVIHGAGLAEPEARAFLREIGRTGDDADLRAVALGRWQFHVFETLWGSLMDRTGAGDRSFDYAGHAEGLARELTGGEWRWLGGVGDG